MKAGQETNPFSTVRKMAVWRVTTMLFCIALFAVWLLVDWRGGSIQLQAWVRDPESTSPNAGGLQSPLDRSFARQKFRPERESQILHNYADDELLGKAEEMEIELHLQREGARASNYSGDDGQLAKLNQGKYKLNSKLKIAFLFLTTSGIPLEPLWRKFFAGHERCYNIYVHSDPSWLRDYGSREKLGIFWGRTVPSAATHRSNPDVVAAERRLIANALLDDHQNEWFALVSDSCIPLRNLSYIYRTLSATSNSFLDSGTGFPGPMMMSRYKARGENVMLPEVPFSEFRLGSQFFAIRRRHAVMIIRDKKYWPKFKLPCRRAESCYPDEHYIQTVIGNLDGRAFQGTPTFFSWNGSKAGHPHSFGRQEITPHLIQAMQLSQNSRFLFARKFRWDTLEPLLALGDLLFK